MDITQYYGIAVGGLLVCILLKAGVHAAARWMPRCAKEIRLLFEKRVYRHLPGRVSAMGAVGTKLITTPNLILYVLFIIGNAICVGINTSHTAEQTNFDASGTTQFVQRLGRIALINLIFLFAGGRMNAIASICGVRYNHYYQMHAWIGAVVFVEVAIHSIIAGTQNGLNLAKFRVVAGLTASCAIGAISLLSVVRHWVYEIHLHAHTILALIVLISLWLHLSPNISRSPGLYVFLASSIYILMKLLRLIQLLYANVSSRSMSNAVVYRLAAGLEVRVQLARRLECRAGQFIYLSIPGLSPSTVFQSHPFQISWVYKDAVGRQVIVLLIQPRKGFTAKLLLASESASRPYRAFVEGPYGKSIAIGNYGTILLFATGIGITGQMLYLKEILELYDEYRVKTRRIALFWEVDAEVHRYWVREWMDKLIQMDQDFILQMQVFIRSHSLGKVPKSGVERLGRHNKISVNYFPMSPKDIISEELKIRRGKTLICVCTAPNTTNEVRKAFSSYRDRDIDLKELEFNPGRMSNQAMDPKEFELRRLSSSEVNRKA